MRCAEAAAQRRGRTRFRFSASSFCPMLAHTSVYTTSAPLTASKASLFTAAVPMPDEFASAARRSTLLSGRKEALD